MSRPETSDKATAAPAGWPAPAKVNLFLHVVGRRSDGYHELQTVFQFLDHCDRLYFWPRPDGRILRTDPLPGLDPESDLTVRAARMLQRESGTGMGADIAVDKRIPLGGGLGGGSSDAATTLWALNHLWGVGLGVDALAVLALRLGADVPVFVRGRAAWAEGVGECLTPVVLDEPWYVVVVPPVRVSTAQVFAAPDLTRDSRPLTIDGFLSGDQGVNVCEPVVRARYPEVAEVLDWLGGFAPARMSGTGACVFAGFGDRGRAEAVLAVLPNRWRGFVARGRNRSPLLDMVAAHGAEMNEGL